MYQVEKMVFFFCTCGTVNLGENAQCYHCGRTYDFERKIYNIDALTRSIEKAKQKTKKKRKKLIALTAVVTIIIVASIPIGFFLFQLNERYRTGRREMQQGNINEAIKQLQQIPKMYRDTDMLLSLCKKYNKYAGVWICLDDYVLVENDEDYDYEQERNESNYNRIIEIKIDPVSKQVTGRISDVYTDSSLIDGESGTNWSGDFKTVKDFLIEDDRGVDYQQFDLKNGKYISVDYSDYYDTRTTETASYVYSSKRKITQEYINHLREK